MTGYQAMGSHAEHGNQTTFQRSVFPNFLLRPPSNFDNSIFMLLYNKPPQFREVPVFGEIVAQFGCTELGIEGERALVEQIL